MSRKRTTTDTMTEPLPKGFMHVKGWLGYAVNRQGSVICCRRAGGFSDWRSVNPTPDRDGYLKLILYGSEGRIRHIKLHTLVLEVFKGPCPPGMVGRHKNGNKLDCSNRNLLWGTVSQNAQDCVRHGTCHLLTKGIKHPAAKVTDAQIEQILAMLDRGINRNVVARKFGLHKGYVTQIKFYRGRDPRKRKREINAT